MFTRKEYTTSVSGKTANGCPVRSAKPPDNMNFHFISPCGAKLYEVFKMLGTCRKNCSRSFCYACSEIWNRRLAFSLVAAPTCSEESPRSAAIFAAT